MNMNIDKNNNPRFVTDYFPLVAVLIYHDFPIISVNRNNPKHAYFEFVETNELKIISERFWGGTLLCEPKRFFNVTKELKSRLYEPREGQV